MTIPNMKNLERYYYDKYHSVQLAKSEAKKFMENYIKEQNLKLNKNKKKINYLLLKIDMQLQLILEIMQFNIQML